MLCHSDPVDVLWGAVIGLAVAAVLAIISSWLNDREKVSENVRDQRIRTYPAVWERTGVVSQWPRTDATRDHAVHLHLDLRTWYYSAGGLFLSEDAQQRYEHLQVVLEALIAKDPAEPFEYDELMDAARWLRDGLAEDLRTHQRHNPIGSWSLRRRRRAAAAAAQQREQAVGALEYGGNGVLVRRTPERRRLVMLTEQDEHLRHVEPPGSGSTTPSA
jgi:hypothetical protein